MKQVLQHLRSGETEVADVPCPAIRAGDLLIRSTCSLVSAGTERMLVEFGRAGWVDKARQQPEKVKLVLDKIKADGLLPTAEAVMNKLDQPLPLGYSNVGIAIEVGADANAFAVGDRVVSNGRHAEIVRVPVNLCAKVPPEVSDQEAAFTVIGAIALQGIRLAAPTLGESVVVTGLGLIGLITTQLLRAQGCRVLGIDYDAGRLSLARGFGAEVVDLSNGEDPVAAARAFSRGRGVDAVIITAATKSNEPVHQAALMSRKRGRIVLVGVTGLELDRADFYEKELSFQVSCSYGPGRYDEQYEERGNDYPIGFVRWTAQRNFEAVLDMMATKSLDVAPLISSRFPIHEAENAYAQLVDGGADLAILLDYPFAPTQSDDATLSRTLICSSPPVQPAKARVAFIGAGNYARAVLMPAFKQAGAQLKTVASRNGVDAVHAARKFDFERATTQIETTLADPEVNAVVIATRHDSHAQLVCQAMASGRHVFVEKPLALTNAELADIERARADAHEAGHAPLLMVGFNRRYAPHVRRIKTLLGSVRQPSAFVMTVNAGSVPATHWTQDRRAGGGRIIGEACHFIDLLRFLAGAPIVNYQATALADEHGPGTPDNAVITLRFEDGSVGTIAYLANGHKSVSKERLEVFAGGRILQLDNYRKLTGYGWPGFRRTKALRQNKGQRECAQAFIAAIEDGRPAPIPFEELLETSRVTIGVAELLQDGRRMPNESC